MDFTGNVSGAHPPNLSYHWTVWYDRRLLPRESRIVRGQGTLRLDVRAPRRVGSIAMNITATLKVSGLPSNCPNTASETAPFVIDKSPELIDEYEGRLSPPDEARHLDNSVVQLRNSPKSRLYFIEYFPAGTSRRTIAVRAAWISGQLKHRRLKAKDFEIVTSDSIDEHARTKIYRIPPWVQKPFP